MATVTRKVARKGTKTQGPSVEQIAEQAVVYLTLQKQIKVLTDKADEVKKDLKSSIEVVGYESEGNQFFDLPEEFNGVKGLKREARTTTSLNVEKTEGFTRAKGLWVPVIDGGVVETVEQIDQDALLARHHEGKISEKELDSLFTSKTIYALVPVRA